jgi:hypothetical protein
VSTRLNPLAQPLQDQRREVSVGPLDVDHLDISRGLARQIKGDRSATAQMGGQPVGGPAGARQHQGRATQTQPLAQVARRHIPTAGHQRQARQPTGQYRGGSGEPWGLIAPSHARNEQEPAVARV